MPVSVYVRIFCFGALLTASVVEFTEVTRQHQDMACLERYQGQKSHAGRKEAYRNGSFVFAIFEEICLSGIPCKNRH